MSAENDPESPATRRSSNWSGTVDFPAERWDAPSAAELPRTLSTAGAKCRPLGTGHSFNAIARAERWQIDSSGLCGILALDSARRTVRVEPGVSYAVLGEWLEARGWALSNLASLPHLSVGGAVSTATHGSGDRNGCLATAVRALEWVAPGGGVHRMDRSSDPSTFPGAVVGLGALGVLRWLELDIVPTFQIRQFVYENVPLAEYIANFDAVHGSAYSVSAFTDWSDNRVGQVWRKCVDDDPVHEHAFFGGTPARTDLHPIRAMDASRCTPQCGVRGPWHLRLPHFLPEFEPSHGDEIQSEYFVARWHAPAALAEVARLGPKLRSLLWISEIRTVAADDLWMSPAYGRPVVGLHFTWRRDPVAVAALLPTLETALAPFDARPHWGKVFVGSMSIPERLADFRALVRRIDPGGHMRNAYLDRILDRDPAAGGL